MEQRNQAAETKPVKEGTPPGGLDLGLLTKMGAVSAALAYAIGMLTINTYLHQLGITDFTLGRPKLVITGVLVLITFSLLALLPVMVMWQASEEVQPARRHSKKMGFLLFFPLVALLGASAWLCFGETTGLGQITVWGIWEMLKHRNFFTRSLASLLVAGELYLPICVAAVSALVASKLVRRATTEVSPLVIIPERIYLPVAIALAVLSVVGYMIIFALSFYAAIPQAFGGGKPYFQSFVISEDGRCQLQQLGIPFAQGQPNITEPLPVLHESDTLVAVWLNKPPARGQVGGWASVVVQLDKKLISASIADPRARTTPKLVSPPLPCKNSLAPQTTQSNP